mgnify:CR=1 FL=1
MRGIISINLKNWKARYEPHPMFVDLFLSSSHNLMDSQDALSSNLGEEVGLCWVEMLEDVEGV